MQSKKYKQFSEMEKKTRLITLKTFEEFKADNANHYAEVLGYFNNILAFLQKNGAQEIETKYKIKMIDAEDWRIEGNVYASELNTEDDTLDTDVIFHNINDKDSIDVNVTGYGELLHSDEGDYMNPPSSESDSHLNIESITLWTDDGSENYSIAVTSEIEKIVLDIINIIAK
jgi:hypothetical protein